VRGDGYTARDGDTARARAPMAARGESTARTAGHGALDQYDEEQERVVLWQQLQVPREQRVQQKAGEGKEHEAA